MAIQCRATVGPYQQSQDQHERSEQGQENYCAYLVEDSLQQTAGRTRQIVPPYQHHNIVAEEIVLAEADYRQAAQRWQQANRQSGSSQRAEHRLLRLRIPAADRDHHKVGVAPQNHLNKVGIGQCSRSLQRHGGDQPIAERIVRRQRRTS